MNRFADYTTDELLGMAEYAEREYYHAIAHEIHYRHAARNAWLDYCNAVAGEVIA